MNEIRPALVDALCGAGFTERDGQTWERDGIAVHFALHPSLQLEVAIGQTRHPVQQWFDDDLLRDTRGPPRLGAPPVPAELDPRRIGLKTETRAQVGAWAERMSMLPTWIEATVKLHEAVRAALDGAATELDGPRPMRVEPGSAFVGRYARSARLPGLKGRMHFSADGRWLAVNEPGLVHVVDPEAGTERSTIPVPPWGASRFAVAPDGASIALRTRDALEVRRDSGAVATIERPPPPPFGVDLMWDAQSRLWLADVTDDGHHALSVRDMDLALLAEIPVPGPREQVRWGEPNFALHPDTNTVVLWHVAGDTFISLTFHRFAAGEIVTAPLTVEPAEDALTSLAIAPDGKELVGLLGNGRLVTWSLPSGRIVAQGVDDPPPPSLRFGPIAHLGGAVAAPLEEDTGWVRHVWCFDPDDHRASGAMIMFPPLRRVDAAGPWLAGLSGPAVQLLRLEGERVAVARVIAGSDHRVERLFAGRDGNLVDVTRDALWSRATAT